MLWPSDVGTRYVFCIPTPRASQARPVRAVRAGNPGALICKQHASRVRHAATLWTSAFCILSRDFQKRASRCRFGPSADLERRRFSGHCGCAVVLNVDLVYLVRGLRMTLRVQKYLSCRAAPVVWTEYSFFLDTPPPSSRVPTLFGARWFCSRRAGMPNAERELSRRDKFGGRSATAFRPGRAQRRHQSLKLLFAFLAPRALVDLARLARNISAALSS